MPPAAANIPEKPVMELVPPKNLGPDFLPVQQCFGNDYRRELPIVAVAGCFVTHSGLALKRLRLVPESVFQGLDPRITRHFYRYALYKYFTERRLRSSEPGLLLLHHHWASGYHHWLTECLLKVQFIDPSQFVVVLPEDYPQFAAESLKMFPFAGTLELPRGQGLQASSLTLVGNPHSGHFNPAHLRELKRLILERFDGPRPEVERLYITRRGDALRRVENEDQVIGTLDGYDFRVVEPAGLSFEDQVRLFSRCRVLVSVHGAGLTNCLFMPEGGRVLELYRALVSEQDRMNACYWRLTTAGNLDYYYQFCAHGENRGGHIDRVDIRVDIDTLKCNVEAMLAGVASSA
jgi:capsular polysaccharide biosynthesis protein